MIIHLLLYAFAVDVLWAAWAVWLALAVMDKA